MKKIILSLTLLLAVLYCAAQNKDYPIQAVPFTKVKFTDNFWLPRIKTNHTVTIPASFARCEDTGRIKNFEMAAAKSGKFCTIFPFDDTDTQEPDGYLYTARTINPNDPHEWAGKERWVKEREMSHELYNSGHLYEAAAAHYQATGKRNLLDIALKNADLVCSVFGHDKRHVAPGHEVVEMGLVKLYRITGKKEYLETAKYFIEERGHFDGYNTKSTDPWKNGAYWQDHIPVVEQNEAIGHAVRAGYLYSAMADVAALTGDQSFVKAVDAIWNNMVEKKIYVQGGIGAVGDGERFGNNYELPNSTAYNETCAAIANVYWNQRMFLLHGESKYIDILEKSLYNGLISGVGMDGKSFFYTNAMEIRNSFHHEKEEETRSGWFPCSCCPTNVARLVPSIPGYVYAQKGNDVYVNLFVNGPATLTLNKKTLSIEQKNNYPWDGNLSFAITPAGSMPFNLLLRVPGWAQNQAMPSDLYFFERPSDKAVTISVNGKPLAYTMQNGYAVISRTWKKGDVVQMDLPMDIRRVAANNNVKDDIGKVALQRGPIMYAAEWPDNEGRTSNIILPPDTPLKAEFNAGLLNGVGLLKGEALAIRVTADHNVSTVKQPFTAIPYYAWAHRGKGEMTVWFPEKVTALDIITK